MKNPYRTEEDVRNAASGRSLRFSVAPGLSLLCNKVGQKYWQFRTQINGKEIVRSLGTYPDMDFETAKAKALEIKSQVQEVRTKKGDQLLQKKLSQVPSKRTQPAIKEGCFKSLGDAKKFLFNLRVNSTLDLETRTFIQLLLFVPAPWKQIATARKNDFYDCGVLERAEWRPDYAEIWPGNNNQRKGVTYPLAKNALQAVNSHPALWECERLFPGLEAKKGSLGLEKTLRSALDALWPNYQIELSGFRDSFIWMANKHSNFKPRLITAVSVGHTQMSIEDAPGQAYEMRALMTWWDDVLTQVLHNHETPTI